MNDENESRDTSFESDTAEDVTKEVHPEKKRKSDESVVGKLIDYKRKHLERKLSSAQRDQLLLQEAKEDNKFRKELSESIRVNS